MVEFVHIGRISVRPVETKDFPLAPWKAWHIVYETPVCATEERALEILKEDYYKDDFWPAFYGEPIDNEKMVIDVDVVRKKSDPF